jgi:Reverse transcriptase (RNA-dependent DNA polymerase)
MTMGLKNASAFFQRQVNNVYDGLKGMSLQAYLDDLVVASETAGLHVEDVRDMLERTRRANLRLKFEKCTFGQREVELLGHKVSHSRVGPNDPHRQCLKEFKEPSNASELLRFLGLLQFFSGHIDRLAEMTAPLYEVLVGTAWNKPKKKK